jgi:hypothetical protein
MSCPLSSVRLAAAIAIVGSCAAAVQAQTVRPRSSSRFEGAVGVIWIGSGQMGATNATESVSSGVRFVLFSTSTEIDAATGIEGRVGFHLTPMWELDAVGSYAKPQLTTTITGDTEGGTPSTASIGVKQATIGGSVVAHLTRFHVGAHGVPFAEAGAAYVRQVYDASAVVVHGQMFELGGGVKYTVSTPPAGRVSAIGVRADVRAVVRRRGVALDGGTRVSPAAGAALFLLF